MKLLGFAILALFLVCIFTPLPNLLGSWMATPSRLESAEAIVVLGAGGVRPDGTLSGISLRRALHGIILWRKRQAPLLVFSGSDRGKHPTEYEARVELARELGIPPEGILTATSNTTRDEATRIGALLRPSGVRRILLVTDSHHMMRAQRLFEQAGFEVLAAPADDFSNHTESPQGRLELMHRILEELLARLYYWTAGHL